MELGGEDGEDEFGIAIDHGADDRPARGGGRGGRGGRGGGAGRDQPKVRFLDRILNANAKDRCHEVPEIPSTRWAGVESAPRKTQRRAPMISQDGAARAQEADEDVVGLVEEVEGVVEVVVGLGEVAAVGAGTGRESLEEKVDVLRVLHDTMACMCILGPTAWRT